MAAYSKLLFLYVLECQVCIAAALFYVCNIPERYFNGVY